ncbi:hypothetical protein ANN_06767 [Periplaneta americana]|uniref:Uncharacterized protein n=1 Tax=Periplaneta americana TaxID=6978 RepID=A0ABQ8TFB4_PERAM|nr:hypothetical protein ANN_06767 [Periplaneta americana]
MKNAKIEAKYSSKIKIVSGYGEKVFSGDGNILYCKLCDVRVTTEKTFNVEQHVRTEKQKRGVQRIENGKTLQQMLVGEFRQSYLPFCEELCTAFICAKIPLSQLGHPKLREFLEKHADKSLPVSSTIRKRTTSAEATKKLCNRSDNGLKIKENVGFS